MSVATPQGLRVVAGTDLDFASYVAARRPALLRWAWSVSGDPHTAEDLLATWLAGGEVLCAEAPVASRTIERNGMKSVAALATPSSALATSGKRSRSDASRPLPSGTGWRDGRAPRTASPC